MLLRPPRISGANRTSFKSGMDSSFSGDIELDQLRGRSGQVSPLKPPKLGEGVGNMGAKVPKIGQGVQPVSPTLQDANTLIPQKPTGISIDQEVMDEVNRLAMGEQQVAMKPTVTQQPPRLGTQDEYGNVIDVSAGGGYAANVPQVAQTGAAPRLAQTATPQQVAPQVAQAAPGRGGEQFMTQPVFTPVPQWDENGYLIGVMDQGGNILSPQDAVGLGLISQQDYANWFYVKPDPVVYSPSPVPPRDQLFPPPTIPQNPPPNYDAPQGGADENMGVSIDNYVEGAYLPPPRLGTQDEYGNVIDPSTGRGREMLLEERVRRYEDGDLGGTQPGTQPPWVGGFGAVPGAGESRWDEELIQGIRNIYDAEMDAALKDIRKQDAGMERELAERNMGFGSSAVYAALDETRKQGARAALSDARTQNAVNKAHEIGNEMIRQAQEGDANYNAAIERILKAPPGEVSALLTSMLVPAMRRAGYSEDEILAMTNTLAEEAWHGSLQLGIEDILERNPEASEADLIAWVQTQRYPNGQYPTEKEARAWLEANKAYIESLIGDFELEDNYEISNDDVLAIVLPGPANVGDPDYIQESQGITEYLKSSYGGWDLKTETGRDTAKYELTNWLRDNAPLISGSFPNVIAQYLIDGIFPPEA